MFPRWKTSKLTTNLLTDFPEKVTSKNIYVSLSFFTPAELRRI